MIAWVRISNGGMERKKGGGSERSHEETGDGMGGECEGGRGERKRVGMVSQ